MIRATVVGSVWATKGHSRLVSDRLVLIVPVGGDHVWVCADPLDAKTGDDVLVSTGSGARTAVSDKPRDRQIPLDAAITAIVSPGLPDRG